MIDFFRWESAVIDEMNQFAYNFMESKCIPFSVNRLIERAIDKVVNRFANGARDKQGKYHAGAKDYAPFPEVKVGR